MRIAALLRVKVPRIRLVFLAAHENVDADLSAVSALPIPLEVAQISQPGSHVVARLLYQGPHREAKNETARPIGALLNDSIPEPGEHDPCRLSATSRDLDQLRCTPDAGIAAGQ